MEPDELNVHYFTVALNTRTVLNMSDDQQVIGVKRTNDDAARIFCIRSKSGDSSKSRYRCFHAMLVGNGVPKGPNIKFICSSPDITLYETSVRAFTMEKNHTIKAVDKDKAELVIDTTSDGRLLFATTPNTAVFLDKPGVDELIKHLQHFNEHGVFKEQS